MNLIEARCRSCNTLLAKMIGIAEIKCRKCGDLNIIGVAPTSAMGFEIKIEGPRAPKQIGVRYEIKN